jgi:hypothetical protein
VLAVLFVLEVHFGEPDRLRRRAQVAGVRVVLGNQ